MIICVITLLLIAFSSLHSLDLSAHLQKEKTGIAKHIQSLNISENESGLAPIECIYVINLDCRPDKWARMQKLSQKKGLKVNRVSAVNGWDLSEEVLKELCGPYPLHIPKGHVGCLLSHLSVINDAYQKGFELIWVLEDDIEFVQDLQQIPHLLTELSKADPDWDIFYTDPYSKNIEGIRLESYAYHPRPDQQAFPIEHYLKRTNISDDIVQIGQRFGTYSMVISKKGIKKILDYFTHVYLWETLDGDIHFIPGIKEYSTRKEIVTVWTKELISNTDIPIHTLPNSSSKAADFEVFPHIQKKLTPIANHLKSIELTEKESGLPSVDCIYVINLDQRPDKWESIKKKCTAQGLSINRMSGVNGWDLSFDMLEKIAGHYPIHMPKGHYGCLLSHLSVLKDAYTRGFDLIWVMEDDVEFLEDPKQLPKLIQELSKIDPKWDLFFTDIDSKNIHGKYVRLTKVKPRDAQQIPPVEYFLKRKPINKDIMQIQGRYGMYSVLISKRGIKKILDYFTHVYINEAIDGEVHLIPNIREYSTRKEVVSVDLSTLTSNTRTPVNQTPSDIFAEAKNYQKEKKYLRAIETYQTRTRMRGNNVEEVYLSYYQMALLQQLEEVPAKIFCRNYYKAFHESPMRAEPLYRLALHYRASGTYQMGYWISNYALMLPKPQEGSDIEEWIYQWGLLMENSLCAYYLGDFAACKDISDRMLKDPALPPHVREQVINNLAWVYPHLQKKTPTLNHTQQIVEKRIVKHPLLIRFERLCYFLRPFFPDISAWKGEE